MLPYQISISTIFFVVGLCLYYFLGIGIASLFLVLHIITSIRTVSVDEFVLYSFGGKLVCTLSTGPHYIPFVPELSDVVRVTRSNIELNFPEKDELVGGKSPIFVVTAPPSEEEKEKHPDSTPLVTTPIQPRLTVQGVCRVTDPVAFLTSFPKGPESIRSVLKEPVLQAINAEVALVTPLMLYRSTEEVSKRALITCIDLLKNIGGVEVLRISLTPDIGETIATSLANIASDAGSATSKIKLAEATKQEERLKREGIADGMAKIAEASRGIGGDTAATLEAMNALATTDKIVFGGGGAVELVGIARTVADALKTKGGE